MSRLSVTIAASSLDLSIPSTGKSTGMMMQDVFLIILASVGVAVLLFAAIYVWSKKRHHHKHRHSSRKTYPSSLVKPAVEEEDVGKEDEDEGSQRRRRRRKRKHNHRPRNPTLAETGGLPPIRPTESSEPPL